MDNPTNRILDRMIFFGPKEISVSKEELKKIYEDNHFDWMTFEEFRARVFDFTYMWENSDCVVVPDNSNLYKGEK